MCLVAKLTMDTMLLRAFSQEGSKGKTKYPKNKSEKLEYFQLYNLYCQFQVNLFQKTMLPARGSVLNATEIQVTDRGCQGVCACIFSICFFFFSSFKELRLMEKSMVQMPRKTLMLAAKSFTSLLPVFNSLFWGHF